MRTHIVPPCALHFYSILSSDRMHCFCGGFVNASYRQYAMAGFTAQGCYPRGVSRAGTACSASRPSCGSGRAGCAALGGGGARSTGTAKTGGWGGRTGRGKSPRTPTLAAESRYSPGPLHAPPPVQVQLLKLSLGMILNFNLNLQLKLKTCLMHVLNGGSYSV